MSELDRARINLEILRIAQEVANKTHRDIESVYKELQNLVW